jgi:hypothetical protein
MTPGEATGASGIVELGAEREAGAGELAARAIQDDDLIGWVQPGPARRLRTPARGGPERAHRLR